MIEPTRFEDPFEIIEAELGPHIHLTEKPKITIAGWEYMVLGCFIGIIAGSLISWWAYIGFAPIMIFVAIRVHIKNLRAIKFTAPASGEKEK